MGRIMECKRNADSAIANALLKAGFKLEQFVYVDSDAGLGWQKGFYSDDRVYYTYVHCELKRKRISLYKEYECGGYVGTLSFSIPDELLGNDDPDEFMEWLDEECEDYINK